MDFRDDDFELIQRECRFSNSNMACSRCGTHGLLRTTRVLTPEGWKPVELLKKGDFVRTLFHGDKKIKNNDCQQIWGEPGTHCPAVSTPLFIPKNVLGNDRAFSIPAESSLMIRHSSLTKMLGHPRCLIKASLLDGFCGIKRVPPIQNEWNFKILFEMEELIVIEGGAVWSSPCENSPLEMLDSFWDQHDPEPGMPIIQSSESDWILTFLKTEMTTRREFGMPPISVPVLT